MSNKALKLAKLYEEDKSDMQSCIHDIVTNSNVDEKTAFVVAKALRNKYLPKVASEQGISETELDALLGTNFNQSNLKNRNLNDKEALASKGSNTDYVDEIGESDDERKSSSAQFVQQRNINSFRDNENNNVSEKTAQKNDQRKENELNKQRGEKMNKNTNSRKALRDKLIKEAEQLLNSSTEGFKHSPKQKYNANVEHSTERMQGSEGNSLKRDTEKFNAAVGKATVPTTNGAEDLLLKDSYDVFKFDGTPDGGLQYTLPKNLFDLEIPSEGEMAGEDFAVPTQFGSLPRKTTVAGFEPEGEEMEDEVHFEEDGDDEDHESEFSFGDEQDDVMGDDFEDEDSDDEFADEDSDDEESVTPEECLNVVESFSPEELDEFVTRLQSWAEENGVDLHGETSSPEKETDDEDIKRESIASVLGPSFDLEKAEDVLYNQLVTAGVDPEDISKLTYAQGVELAHKIVTSQSMDVEDKRPVQKITLSEDEEDDHFDKMYGNSDDSDDEDAECEGCGGKANSDYRETKLEKESQVKEARIKTAYRNWSKLAAMGLVDVNEIDNYVNEWLNEGLTVNAMNSQAELLSRTASNRLASKSKDDDQVKFSNSIVTSPQAFNFGNDKLAISDLRHALQGVFTQPEID